MARPEIVDSSSFEVVLDNRWRDVRLARDSVCISKLLRDPLHNRGHRPLLLSFGRGKSVLLGVFCEIDRCEQRAAPGPEVLRAELLAEIDLHVVVEPLAREVVEVSLPPVLEDAGAALDLQQPTNLRSEIVIDELGTYANAGLRGKRELDAFPANLNVTPKQCRDAVGPLPGGSLGADAEPAERDETERDGRNPPAIELLLIEAFGHRGAQTRQALAEADQAVVLLLLLRRAVIRVIQVLLPAGLVVTRRLELCVRPRRNPDVRPGRWNRERLDALEHVRVTDHLSIRVDVKKRPFAPDPARHLACTTTLDWPAMRDERTLVVLEGDETGQELLEESMRAG